MKRILSAALALSLLGGTAAMAQWHDRDRGADRGGYWHGRGADPWAARHWGRGDRLPGEYWGGSYEVRDWNRYHLRARRAVVTECAPVPATSCWRQSPPA